MISTTGVNLAAVAKLRLLLGLPSIEVLPAGDRVMVAHVSDQWSGRKIVGSCPGHDKIPALAPRLTTTDDAADIVVVDWLTDQGNRRGSTVMLLADGGKRVRLAPCEDGEAFAGKVDNFSKWINLAGSPTGFADLGTTDRVEVLARRLDEISDEYLDWLETLEAVSPDHVRRCAEIFQRRLALLHWVDLRP